MIDKARVEDLQHECQRMSRVDADLVLDIETEALPILTDYLALLAIVETLAASQPVYCRVGLAVIACASCGAEVANDAGTHPHAVDCPYRQARELLGNPIEAVGE